MSYLIFQRFILFQCNIIIVLALMCILPLAPAYAQCANPAGVRGEEIYNDDFCVMQYCDGTNWMAWGAIPSTCTPSDACASVGPGDEGTICADGSVYAGQLTGTNLFVPPADNSGGIAWNNGTTNWTFAGVMSQTDGTGNTATLITFDSDSGAAGIQPHQAAQLCADLTAHGKTDWYLPARNELNVLYTNAVAIGGFDTSGVYYWASTENNGSTARKQRFSDGFQSVDFKVTNIFAVRCIRR